MSKSKNMYKKLKYIIAAGVFLACLIVGFLFAKFINKDTIKEPEGDTIVNAPPKGGSEGVTDTVGGIEPIDTIQAPPPVDKKNQVKITNTSVQKTGENYTLYVQCYNPDNVGLRYEIPALGLTSVNGIFNNVPGCKSGSYTVNVVDKSNGKILSSKNVKGFEIVIKPKQVDMMSKEEFQRLLLSSRYIDLLKNPKVAKSIALSYVGLNQGEKRPNNIQDVHAKIDFEIWSSLKVVSVGYDESGRINSAVIQPVYP